jgi:hypothetical protein
MLSLVIGAVTGSTTDKPGRRRREDRGRYFLVSRSYGGVCSPNDSHADVDQCQPAHFQHSTTPMLQENVYHLDHGAMLIMKCRWLSNNERSPTKGKGEGCHTSGTLLIPLCANPECTHIPSIAGNNASPVDAKFKPAFQLRQKMERARPDMRVHRPHWIKTVSETVMMGTKSRHCAGRRNGD